MPTQVQWRRGTTTQNNSFTGAEGEVTVDTTLDTLRIHDGSTAGGHRLFKWTEALGLGDLSDPNDDAILFWDDSAGNLAWMSESTGLSISGTSISLSHLGIESLSDPNADRIVFWDDSSGALQWLTIGSNLTLSGTTLSADYDGDITGVTAGDGLSGGGTSGGITVALDLNELTAATVDVANDSIAIIDAGDSSSKKEAISDLISAIAGTGLSGSSGVLNVGTLNQDTTGNAATATALETARTINGVSFDGTANVTTLTAGTGVSVSGTAVSIGQAVATSDDVTFADIAATGNVTITGNLDVNGTTTTLDTTNSTIADRLIELGNGTTGTPANDMGIVLERGDSDNAFIGWDESADKFLMGTGSFTGASTGNLTVTTGTLVANLEGNVTGNVTGNTSGSSGSCTGNAATASALATARTLSFTGDVTGTGDFDGSGNLATALTIAANSVALGTDTTGNYMAQVAGGDGITISHTQGEGSTATITGTAIYNASGTKLN